MESLKLKARFCIMDCFVVTLLAMIKRKMPLRTFCKNAWQSIILLTINAMLH
ncbi:MAG: hypothetical protein HDT10_01560 [Helicobacter sp.]|nr:hypothetical protein [Helicobacter sp.]